MEGLDETCRWTVAGTTGTAAVTARRAQLAVRKVQQEDCRDAL
jgi:hypothetical protein